MGQFKNIGFARGALTLWKSSQLIGNGVISLPDRPRARQGGRSYNRRPSITCVPARGLDMTVQ